MSVPELETDQLEALSVARELIAQRLPVFTARRNPKYTDGAPEFHLPEKWQDTKPTVGALAAWRPGDALCLVAGHGLDIVDVDTKNGAKVDEQRRRLEGCGVTVLAEVSTPSGGAHFYVRSAGICSSALTSVGVDFRGRGADNSGSGFVYLPGTLRPKYQDKGYEWLQDLDPEDLNDVRPDVVEEQGDAVSVYLAGLGIKVRTGKEPEGETVTGEPVDFLPDALRRDLTNAGPWPRPDGTVSIDRSVRFMHLVGACRRAGLTQGQAVTALAPWCSLTGKYVGRVPEEVARVWPKVEPDAEAGGQEQDSPEGPTYPSLGRVYSLEEIKDLPPIKPLVKGWLSTPSAAVLVGAYGIGKSALTLSIACSLASGTPFLGIEVERTKVLYLVGEGVRGLPLRVDAWQKCWGKTLPEGSLVFMTKQHGSLKERQTWRELAHYCQDNAIGLVVLDTLSSLAPDADETKDAPMLVSGLNHLAEQINGTALLVHHPGWSAADRTRGGYQFEGNVDEVLLLTSASEGSEHLSVKVKKAKDGESGHTHYLRRIVIDLARKDEDGRDLRSVTVEGSRLADTAVPVRARIEAYLEACGSIGATAKEIAQEIGAGASSGGFRRTLRELGQDGKTTTDGAKRSARYYLTDQG